MTTLREMYLTSVLLYGTDSAATRFVLYQISIADEGEDAVCNHSMMMLLMREKENGEAGV